MKRQIAKGLAMLMVTLALAAASAVVANGQSKQKLIAQVPFDFVVAEKTLRTWSHRSDKKIGQVLEWKETANPPPGSSGIQVRMKFSELLDGYRPGRIVRVKCHNWIFVTIPTEERMKSLDER